MLAVLKRTTKEVIEDAPARGWVGASETIKILETVPIIGKDGTVNSITCTL